MGADSHVELTGSVLGVPCAQGEESPELGGNLPFLYRLDPPLTPSCPENLPSLPGPLFSRPVHSHGVRKQGASQP